MNQGTKDVNAQGGNGAKGLEVVHADQQSHDPSVNLTASMP
jgi:hypothetical protein